MENKMYYGQNKDIFDKLSDKLADLVDDLKGFEKNVSNSRKEKIISDLDEMSKLAKILNGITQQKFSALQSKITLYLDDSKDFDKVIFECVTLQNQLWEL